MSQNNNEMEHTISKVGSIVTIVQFVFAAIGAIFSYCSNFSLTIKIVIWIVCGILVLIAVFRILIPRCRNNVIEWLCKILTPKSQISKQDKLIRYVYTSRESMFIRVQYYLKVNFGTCEHIVEKLKWSAGDTDLVEPIAAGQSITFVNELNDVQSNLGYQFFHIVLSKSRSVGDRPLFTGFKTKELSDPNRKSRTCLIVGVYEPTNNMTLRVEFPSNLKVINVRKMKYAHYIDLNPYYVKETSVQVDNQNNHYVEFNIPNPVLGGKYVIDWDFDDS